MVIRDEVLKELLGGVQEAGGFAGVGGVAEEADGGVGEKALSAEMTDYLGYEKHEASGRGSGNSRKGTTEKTLKTESGEIPIEVSRDRNGGFEPQLVKKHQTHFDGFDEKIITKEFGKKRIEFRKGDRRRLPANFSHGQIRPLKSSYTKNRIPL